MPWYATDWFAAVITIVVALILVLAVAEFAIWTRRKLRRDVSENE